MEEGLLDGKPSVFRYHADIYEVLSEGYLLCGWYLPPQLQIVFIFCSSWDSSATFTGCKKWLLRLFFDVVTVIHDAHCNELYSELSLNASSFFSYS